MKKGFTLAEVMITLVVIGTITAVIIPVAIHSKPNENVMKFKKAHNTLHQVISTLVTSDKYYLDGDLGVKADGTQLIGKYNEYFCSTIADVLLTQNYHCLESADTGMIGSVNLYYGGTLINDLVACEVYISGNYSFQITSTLVEKTKEDLDSLCKETITSSYVIANDNITFFEVNPAMRFGSKGSKKLCSDTSAVFPRYFSPPNQFPAIYSDQNGMDINYKAFCVDIDSIPTNNSSSCDDINDICPFGYGIRADGKILTGKRADEWLNKSIQGEN